jgi:hypothetical protein
MDERLGNSSAPQRLAFQHVAALHEYIGSHTHTPPLFSLDLTISGKSHSFEMRADASDTDEEVARFCYRAARHSAESEQTQAECHRLLLPAVEMEWLDHTIQHSVRFDMTDSDAPGTPPADASAPPDQQPDIVVNGKRVASDGSRRWVWHDFIMHERSFSSLALPECCSP